MAKRPKLSINQRAFAAGSGAFIQQFLTADYSTNFTKQVFTLTGSVNAGEYGVSEYNTTAEYTATAIINTPKVNTSGNGEVVTIGLETEINDTSFSIQKIDIHAILGRLI